jgi:hypothetical protein
LRRSRPRASTALACPRRGPHASSARTASARSCSASSARPARQDIDRPATRDNFEIRASNDPAFATYTVVGRQGATALPFGSTLTGTIDVRQRFGYVRVAKTDGAYFFLADFSVQQGDGALEDATSVPSVSPSTYYTIQNVNSGMVADVSGASTSDGASVIQWQSNGGTNQQWNGGDNQLWYCEPLNGGWVIRNFESKQALEVGGGSTTAGAAIDQWMALNQANQTWTIQWRGDPSRSARSATSLSDQPKEPRVSRYLTWGSPTSCRHLVGGSGLVGFTDVGCPLVEA